MRVAVLNAGTSPLMGSPEPDTAASSNPEKLYVSRMDVKTSAAISDTAFETPEVLAFGLVMSDAV